MGKLVDTRMILASYCLRSQLMNQQNTVRDSFAVSGYKYIARFKPVVFMKSMAKVFASN
jgi:hypothetical protein